MQPRPLTIGVVLAGGQSKRMGKDKALLQIKGKTQLIHTIDLLGLVRPKLDGILVSGRQSGIASVTDIHQNLGPIGGIYSVMQAVQPQAKALLIMPIDMPLMTPQALSNLMVHANSLQSFDAFIYKNKWFPLFIRLTPAVSCFFEKNIRPPHAENKSHSALRNEQLPHSIQNLLTHLATCAINWDKTEEHIFTNVNTQEDWNNLYP